MGGFSSCSILRSKEVWWIGGAGTVEPEPGLMGQGGEGGREKEREREKENMRVCIGFSFSS